jgi:hypothetical protein
MILFCDGIRLPTYGLGDFTMSIKNKSIFVKTNGFILKVDFIETDILPEFYQNQIFSIEFLLSNFL